MENAKLTLFHTLIAKSIAETCFVAVLALSFFFTAFPPYFRGWVEATPEAIAGWIVNDRKPFEHVRVQLYIDGNFVADGIANQSRPDVQKAGWSKDQWHGFVFAVQPLRFGTHEARVYALVSTGKSPNQTQQLVGDPMHFTVDERGRLTEIPRETP
jgi:hypothetical protein